MTIKLIRTTLLISSLIMASAAFAQSPDQGGGMMGQGMSHGNMGPGMSHDNMGSGMSHGTMGPGMRHGAMGPSSGMDFDVQRKMSMSRLMSLPDLSDDQRQKLKSRHRELEKQIAKLQSQALDARFALEDALSKDTPDPQAVGRAMQDAFDVRKQMVEAHIAAHNDALGMLTDEQRETLKKSPGSSRMRHRPGMNGKGDEATMKEQSEE